MEVLDASSKEDIGELLRSADAILTFNDDFVGELGGEFKGDIISFSPYENETTKLSKVVIPIKPWIENEGSFTNAMGTSQSFNPVITSEILSEIEAINKL